ncbi:MAG: ABC transporter ATP-binding protein [Methanomicrobiales archaeon]|nr:ABC transporter ATP-binding protein [Methanomicrobiales archaeon]
MISARGLSKVYDGFSALDGVGLELGDNEILGVIGHNGAGKTTLLKIMTGLVPPTGGSLTIHGIDVVKDPVGLKRILGYLPEDTHLYETMTVGSYLTFFGEIYGMAPGEIRERSARLLSTLCLEAGRKKIGELSKGMKRKVAIARSLLHDPAVLIYDEPSSGLDPMTSRTIIEFLKELKGQGKTIVFSAHNLYQVEEICDRVMILRRGKEVAYGSIPELREMFGSITYTLTFSIGDLSRLGNHRNYRKDGSYYAVDGLDIEGMNELATALPAAGGRVERVESHYPSLEQMLVKIGN